MGDPLEFGAGGTFGISWERSRSWTHIPRAGNSQKFPKVPKSQPLEEPVFHGAPFPWGYFVRSFLLPPQPLQLLCFPQIQFIGAGNGFWGIPTGFRENSPPKKRGEFGINPNFCGFFPNYLRIVPVPGIPPLAELGRKSSPAVSLMSISPKNWDLGLFSPLFSGIMWNSGRFGLNLVGKIPNFPQGSQRGRALGSSRNSFFPSSPKLFECSRNSLPWKSLWSGGGFSQRFRDPHLFFLGDFPAPS